MVLGTGLEPAQPKGHMALNHACLPISPPELKRKRDEFFVDIFYQVLKRPSTLVFRHSAYFFLLLEGFNFF